MSKSSFPDILRIFGSDKYSSHFDWEKAISSNRKNAQALGDAAKSASDSFQTILNRQSALVQKQAEETSKLLSNISSTRSSETSLDQLTRAIKVNTEIALAGSKELLEISAKSANEVADILNKRLSEAMSEYSSGSLSSYLEPTETSTKKKNAA